MKKIIPITIAILFFQSGMAQQPVSLVNNPYPKTITITGSASMEVIPDEIYVNVELSEYQKRGESKKDIETIKAQFLESCRTVGIPDSLVNIASYSGSNSYYSIRKKKKSSDMMAAITYQVKFKSSKLMDELVEKLDDNATQNFQIVSVDHSNIAAFRKQLKIKAIQAAKEKGVYLAEAIGEKVGEAITINEPGEWQPLSFENNYANLQSQYSFADSARVPNNPEVDFKKMKLRYEVSIVFALK